MDFAIAAWTKTKINEKVNQLEINISNKQIEKKGTTYKHMKRYSIPFIEINFLNYTETI